MSKLLRLKHWLTITDAAKYLSASLSEPVAESDIFRFALDGSLTLSAYFVSPIYVKSGEPIPIAFAEKVPGISLNGAEPYEIVVGMLMNNDAEVLKFEEEVFTLDDEVLDLPMIGGERISCERAYERLTNGPFVDMANIDGTFLRLPNSNQYFQICQSYLPKAAHVDTKGEWKRYQDEVWFPVGTLPDDVVFVVRVESLMSLLASVSAEEVSEKPLAARERGNLLTVVGVLLELIQSEKPGRDSEAAIIDEMLQNYGEKPGIAKRTLEQKFAEAKRVLRNR